jgi:acetolactate synthase I/II/III large subunit
MSTTRPPPDLARRNFLKGATLAGAATLASPTGVQAQPPHLSPRVSAMVRPNLVAETMPPSNDPVTQTSSGGDFMVDVLKTLNIDYCAINPASSFRGIQEAIINYGKNTKPELITCPHEEIAVSMAQGYAKMDGRPMAVLAHGTVGLQHAAMGLYNAFCDRVAVYLMIGNIVDAEKRMPGVEWAHSAIDPAALVRDFVKWDDQPASLQHFAESAVRAYKIATTPPMAPVLLSLDAELQENPITDPESLHIPKLAQVALPQGDPGAVDEAARLLVRAQNPVILCDRVVRTPAGFDRIIELAETLQCAVIDLGGRMNFPSRHPLNQSFRRPAIIGQADLIFGIELNDYYGAVHGFSDRIIRHTSPLFRPNVRTISLGVRDLYTKSNYQEFQRYADVDLAIAGDGEATLPALIEAVKRRVDAGRAAAYEARGKALAAAQMAMVEAAKSEATIGWDATPISTARLCAALWAQIRHEDWSLVGNGIRMLWPQRLWDFDASYRWNGFSGGAGVGYNAPASAGAALANKKHGRLSVSIQGDGDMMFAPGTLWTAAHHHIPILYIMHNNRAYHQEYMYVQAMANRHARGINTAYIGTTLTDPDIDFATVAKGFGVYGQGPITDPNDLGPALERAIAVVKRGEPALVDVVTEPR